MDLGNYTGGGAGRGFSTADQSMAASGTTGSISGGYSGPSGDSGSGSDNYATFVQASKSRKGLDALKDYFTGDQYDYGYQRNFRNDLKGIGGFLLGLANPALGLAYRGYQAFKPELNTFYNSPTIEAFLNNRRNLNEEVPFNKDTRIYQPEGIGQIKDPMLVAELTKAQQKALAGQRPGYDAGLFTIDDVRQNISPLNNPKSPATIEEIKQYWGII